MNIARQTVRMCGLEAHYEVVGAGEPVVLVHGFAESTHLWYHNLPTLAERYRVYLLDLPGFGTMRRYRRQFELQELSAWLAGWMQAVGLEAASLVGHSMGGYICLNLAAVRPERVKRLVLVASLGMPLRRSVARLMGPALRAILHTHPSPWLSMCYDCLRAGPTMLLRAARQIVALDASSVPAPVDVPTLLIWGENDELVPFPLGRQLHERLPGTRLLVMHGANHFCMYERPHEFNQALSAFLQGQNIGAD